MNRSQRDRLQDLVGAIQSGLRRLEAELERDAPKADVLRAGTRKLLTHTGYLQERIRYLGWRTDEAILDYLSDGNWRRRRRIQSALERRGARAGNTRTVLTRLTRDGSLEMRPAPREDRGNRFGEWRLAGGTVGR